VPTTLPASWHQAFSLRPNLYQDFRQFYGLFWDRKLLDPVLMELLRLRIAQLHGCQAELGVRYQAALDAGLRESQLQELSCWHSSTAWQPLQRHCLNLAERFVMNPQRIRDEDTEPLRRQLGDAGLMSLLYLLAALDGFCRFQCLLGVQTSSSWTSPRTVATPSATRQSLY